MIRTELSLIFAPNLFLLKTKLFLITPPFTQLNTPYPATAYIKGFLNTKNIESVQADLGIEVILKLFSKEGLQNLFKVASLKFKVGEISDNSKRIYRFTRRIS